MRSDRTLRGVLLHFTCHLKKESAPMDTRLHGAVCDLSGLAVSGRRGMWTRRSGPVRQHCHNDGSSNARRRLRLSPSRTADEYLKDSFVKT